MSHLNQLQGSFSHLSHSLLFLPLSGRLPDITLILMKGPLNLISNIIFAQSEQNVTSVDPVRSAHPLVRSRPLLSAQRITSRKHAYIILTPT